MKLSELIAEVAEDSGVTKADVGRVLRSLASVAEAQLVAGKKVPLRGIGTLDSRWLKPRSIRPIDAASRILLDGRWTASFRPSASLKKALLARTPQRYADPAHQAAWRLAETLLSDLELYHQERVPEGLQVGTELSDVRVACEASFGALWSRAARSFNSEAPAERDQALDYLAFAARRRWGAPDSASAHP